MAFDCVLGAWQAHEHELHGWLLKRVRDPFATEDLLQEILLKAMRQGQAFCVLDNPRAWLFQVARNALVDQQRRRKPLAPLTDDLVQDDEPQAPIDDLTICLERNLSRLSVEDSDIIRQCDLQGLRQQDYADRHGLSLAATKSRLLRARRRLRQSLVTHCQVHIDDTGRICCFTPPDSAQGKV